MFSGLLKMTRSETSYFLKEDVIMYSKGRFTYRRRRKRAGYLLFAGSLLEWPQAGAGLVQSLEPELLPGLPCRCRSPSTWATFYCFPRSLLGAVLEAV